MDYTDSKNPPSCLQDLKNNTTETTYLQQKGIGDSVKREPIPSRNFTVAEKPIKGYNNSFLILGKDRKDEETSGYGGKGHPEAGMIHLVAGHFGANMHLFKEDEEGSKVANPSFMIDSAYVYISQTSDIDDYLELKNGSVGRSIKKSAIAIKADDVRIVGERGIKLVTRRYGQDSKRKDAVILRGIDLIAGNDDSDLQPMLKGTNTKKSLEKILELIKLTVESLNEVMNMQARVNIAVASHFHTTATPGSPTIPTDQILIENCSRASNVFSTQTQKRIQNILNDLVQFSETYLQNTGNTYILSKYNNTN